MKIHRKGFMLLFGVIVLLSSCGSNNKKVENLAPNAHQVIAKEVIQTSNYTYVYVSDDGREYWIAIEKADVNEGKTYFWSAGMEMNNFTSKELKRTFASIFFVQDFTDKPILQSQQKPLTSPRAGKQQAPEHEGISVPRAEGGVTVAELYSKGKSFEGKMVKIQGEVVRFSPGIMNKNWVHLQDGTKDGNKYDLTVTTKDTVKTGEVVIFKGVLALNKDFGAGYIYEVIVEDAKLIK